MRTLIVGGPKRGKSTIAREYVAQGVPTYCTDARSMVAEPIDGVTYAPEGLGWSEASAYVAEHWLTLPGPWCIEGVAVARAVRKWLDAHPGALPADRIVYLGAAKVPTTTAQEAMAKGIATVWAGFKGGLDAITERR